MAQVRDRAPVRPSQEATNALRDANQASSQAERRREEQNSKLAEARPIVERLVSHRRANNFTELFQRALDRNR